MKRNSNAVGLPTPATTRKIRKTRPAQAFPTTYQAIDGLRDLEDADPMSLLDILDDLFATMDKSVREQFLLRVLSPIVREEKVKVDAESSLWKAFKDKDLNDLDLSNLFSHTKDEAPLHVLLLTLLMAGKDEQGKIFGNLQAGVRYDIMDDISQYLLDADAQNPTRSKTKKLGFQNILSTCALIFNIRSQKHTLIQKLNGIITYFYGLASRGIDILKGQNFVTSRSTIVRFLRKIKDETLAKVPTVFEPYKFQIVFDNLNYTIRPCDRRSDVSATQCVDYTACALKSIVHDDPTLPSVTRMLPPQLWFDGTPIPQDPYVDTSKILPDTGTELMVRNWRALYVMKVFMENFNGCDRLQKDWQKKWKDHNAYKFGKVEIPSWIPMSMQNVNEGTYAGTGDVLLTLGRKINLLLFLYLFQFLCTRHFFFFLSNLSSSFFVGLINLVYE
jgi:hypothetical protein